MRIQNILALTDFSIQAEHGLDRAAALAAAHGARLRILYACETPPLQLSDPMARLDQRARQLARRHGVEVSTIAGTGRLLEDGLTEAARADLMVAHRRMYRDGAVLPRRQLLYPLLRRSPCPVLVVQRPLQGAYARVLVSVDFCAASRPLVRYAGDLEAGAALELFHAIDTHNEARLRSAEASTAAVQAYRREVQQYAQQQLYRLSDVFEARRNRVGTLIGRGDAVRHLTVQQERIGADLVVLGQERRSRLMDWVRGSVPRKLLAGGMKSDLLVVPHDCLGVWHEGRQPASPTGRLPA